VREVEMRIGWMGFSAALAVLILLPSLLAPPGSAAEQDPVAAAESAAQADAETAEGKKFGEALGQAFGREHGSTIQRCAKEAKRGDLSGFDLFVRVDGAGVVDQALVKPSNTLATCVRDAMPGWKVSVVPPHAGFWVEVSVNLKSE